MNRDAWKTEFEGTRILIWGFGREGKSSLRWIRSLCPDLPVDIAEGNVTESLKESAASFGNTRVLSQEDTDFSAYLKGDNDVMALHLKEYMVSFS